MRSRDNRISDRRPASARTSRDAHAPAPRRGSLPVGLSATRLPVRPLDSAARVGPSSAMPASVMPSSVMPSSAMPSPATAPVQRSQIPAPALAPATFFRAAGPSVGGVVQRDALESVEALGTAAVDRTTEAVAGALTGVPGQIQALLGGVGGALLDGLGWIFGGSGGDLGDQLLRGVVGGQGRETIRRLLLSAADYAGAPVVAGGQSLLRWGLSAVTPAFISTLTAAARTYAVPVLGLLQQVHGYFKLLPEAVQTVIVYAIARGLRRFLGRTLGEESWGETIDAYLDSLFTGPASTTFYRTFDWYDRFTRQPVTVAYEMYWSFRGQPVASPAASGSEAPPPSDGTSDGDSTADGTADGTAESVGAPVKQSADRSLAKLDVGFLRIDVGQPRLAPKAAVTRAQRPVTPTDEASGTPPRPSALDALRGPEAPLTRPGGLALPFDLAISLFGVELSAEQRNELALPWRGGFSLVVPHIGLRAPSGPLAGLFGTTALYAEDLVVDETGLRSLAIGIRGLRFGDVLAIDELGGRWQKGEGFVISGKGRLNAGGGVPPIAGELVVRLGTDGAFIGAGLDLELPSKLTPVAGLTLSGLGFTGLFTRSGDVTLAFRGSLAVGGESGLLGAAIEGARFAYERKGGDPTRGGFQVGATLISLRAGPLGLDIHDVQLSTNRDLRRFGGIGLHAALAQRFNIPVVSVPIPIVPGLEAYVDLDAFGDIGAKLAGSLKRGGASGPLAASGEVSAHGALGVRLSAGVQVGSQLAAALAVGLFAEGKASAEGKATLGGKLSLEGFKVRPAAGAPFEAAYALSGSVVASAGLEIKAKALHVFKKTLYQRTFKTWTLGKYETDGKALLGGKADDWQIKPGESGFAGGLPKPPEHADAAVESHQVDDYLLKEGLAIARGAELRRERVDEITTHYLERDRALISRLDETAQRAADARSRLFDVKQRFLSSVRFGKRIEQLKTESQQLAAEVEALRQSYRTVNLILVDVRGAVASVSDLKLDLGETTLFERLERALRKRAAIDDSKVTALDEKGTALADGARQAASGEEDAV